MEAGNTNATANNNADPFDEYVMVSLSMPGASTGKSVFERHVVTGFKRLDKDNISALGKLKMRFYRTLKKYSTFELDNKYVVSGSKMKIINQEYSDLYLEFVEERKRLYNDLMANWDSYVDQVYSEVPNFKIPRDEIDELKPTSEDFIEMNYITKLLSTYVKEHAGIGTVFTDPSAMPQAIRDRFENQRLLTTEKIRKEYQAKLDSMQEMLDKMKNYVKKKGKNFEKLSMKFQETSESVLDMSDILDERDIAQVKVDAAMEALSASMEQDSKKPKKK